jgi:hypothetical protein
VAFQEIRIDLHVIVEDDRGVARGGPATTTGVRDLNGVGEGQLSIVWVPSVDPSTATATS